MTSTLQPTGSLEPYQLLVFADRLAEARFTGLLRLRIESEEIRIYTVDGDARFCMGSGVQHSFAAHLLRGKIFSKVQLRDQLEIVKQRGVRLEDLLIENGTMEHRRVRALQQRLSHFVFGETCGKGPGTYRLDQGTPPPVVQELVLDPWKAFAMWVRDWDSTDHQAEIAQFGGRQLVPTDLWQRGMPSFQAVYAEPFLHLARAIGEGTCLRMEPDSAAKMVFALQRAGMLQFGDELEASAVLDAATIPDPPASPPEKTAPEPTPQAKTSAVRAREAITRARMTPETPIPVRRPDRMVAPPPSATILPQLASQPSAGVDPAELSGLQSLLAREGFASEAAPAAAVAAPPPEPKLSPRLKPLKTADPPMPPRKREPSKSRPAPPPADPRDLPEVALEVDTDSTELQVTVNAGTPGDKGLVDALEQAVAAASADEKKKKAVTALAAKKASTSKARKAKKTSTSGTRTRYEVEPVDLAAWLPAMTGRTRPNEPALAQIFDFRASLAEKNHFEILGVSPGAPLSAIHMARSTVSERFDPTSFMGTYLPPEIRDDLDVIQRTLDHVTAHLVEEPTRRYLERGVGAMTDEGVAAYFGAHAHYRRGRELHENDALGDAKVAFELALESNPTDPWYHLWNAQVVKDLSVERKSWSSVTRGVVIAHLRDAIALDETFEKARLLLGDIHREAGEVEAAVAQYEAVLAINPRSQDARRAVRELQESGSGESIVGKVGGLLGRLRKDR